MRATRKKQYIGLCLTLCAVIACGTGVFFLRESDESKPLTACGGVIDKEPILELFGADEVEQVGDRSESNTPEEAGNFAECIIRVPGKYQTVKFSIGDETTAARILREIRHDDISIPGSTSSPIGYGWRGMVTVQNKGTAHATIVLPCAKAENSKVIVNVTGQMVDSDIFTRKEKVASLARVSADTARDSARKWNCKTRLGSPIKSVPRTPTTEEQTTSLSKVSGTCKGLREVSEEAEQWDISGAFETVSSNSSLIEECFLYSPSDSRVYRLTALHGIFADAFRGTPTTRKVRGDAGQDTDSQGWSWTWASATCGEESADSLFVISNLHGTYPRPEFFTTSPEFEQSALAAFAKESVQRRGCRDLKLP